MIVVKNIRSAQTVLAGLSHDIAPIENTLGVICRAFRDENFSKEELTGLIEKAHNRLLQIQNQIQTALKLHNEKN